MNYHQKNSNLVSNNLSEYFQYNVKKEIIFQAKNTKIIYCL